MMSHHKLQHDADTADGMFANDIDPKSISTD